MILQPTSLRRYILVGFFVSLIPLGVLLWQSRSVLVTAGKASIYKTQQATGLVRNAVAMDSIMVDVERSVRQFVIVGNPSLRQLAEGHLNNYLTLLAEVCSVRDFRPGEFCNQQQTLMSQIRSSFEKNQIHVLEEQFRAARSQQGMLMDAVWHFVDVSMSRQKDYVEERKEFTNWLIIGLVMLTSVIMYWMSGRLAAPVKQLEEKIRRIGAEPGGRADLEMEFSGPRELKQIFDRLDWLSGRLEQLESLRLAFLRHAAHELKTPLSTIREGCSILSDELAGPMNEGQREVVQLLWAGTEQLKTLTEQLLDYNLVLQQADPELETFDPVVLIREAVSRYELSFRNRRQELGLHCTPGEICSDRTLFARILDNLLNNIQAYGDEEGRVRIELAREGTDCILIVENSSPPLTEEQKKRVFEPFYRGGIPRRDQVKGTGLGLSIVSDCVRILGGQVRLADSGQYNFSVRIRLPQADLP